MAQPTRETIAALVAGAHDDFMRALVDAGDSPPPSSRPVSPADAGFLDPADAEARLSRFCRHMFAADIAVDHVVDLVHGCATSASPDAALRNYERYFDRIGSPNVFVDTIVAAAPLREMITTVFASSQYMADILVRSPGLVYWLTEQSTWNAPDTADALREILERESSRFSETPSKLDAVRRAHRQHLLRIGTQDLMGTATIEETTRRLSDLADAVSSVVLALVTDAARAVSDIEPPAMAVIAMGKLGSRELNYSSDIDLIYVCADAGDDAVDLATRIAKRFTEAMSETTDEGYLYRVDLRLRPDGKAGPLVNTQTSLRIYYEGRGRPWEFQALLKARVIAGDQALGMEVLAALGNLIFSQSHSYSPVDSVAQMRTQIGENVPARERDFNIKLMAGGIRDVEFVTQALQLVHGPHVKELRTQSTVQALSVIRERGLLEPREVDNLVDAYRFFRLVEHRVQMMHQIKTHTIPSSDDEIALLARRAGNGPLGDFTHASFLDTLSLHLGNVRAFTEGFFEGTPASPHAALLMLAPDDEQVADLLSPHGFRDSALAARTIHTLAHGSFPRFLDRNARASFEKLLPLLLEQLAKFGDPDAAIINFQRMASAGRSESAFYKRLVDSEPSRELCCAIAGMSSYLSKRVAVQFEALDSLMRSRDAIGFETQFREIPEWDRFNARIAGKAGSEREGRQNRQRAWFDRTRLHDFVARYRGGFRRVTSSPGRTWVAVRQLAHAFDTVIDPADRAAVFALGSYATEEARMTSDVDLLVVTDGADVPRVTGAVQVINSWFTDGGVLKLDFRLRGEGASAPLVQELSFYRDYFDKRAASWERMALSKCRAIWGDKQLIGDFTDLLRSEVTRPYKRSDVEGLVRLRAQLEGLAPKKFRAWDTKRAPGGRYDIDYLVAVALSHVDDNEDTLGMGSVERIERITEAGLINRTEAKALLSALELYSLVEYLMELQELTIPTSIEKNDYLTRYLDATFSMLDLPAPDGVDKRIEHTKRAVRDCYTRVMTRTTPE